MYGVSGSPTAGAVRCSPVSRSLPNQRSHAIEAGQVSCRSMGTDQTRRRLRCDRARSAVKPTLTSAAGFARFVAPTANSITRVPLLPACYRSISIPVRAGRCCSTGGGVSGMPCRWAHWWMTLASWRVPLSGWWAASSWRVVTAWMRRWWLTGLPVAQSCQVSRASTWASAAERCSGRYCHFAYMSWLLSAARAASI